MPLPCLWHQRLLQPSGPGNFLDRALAFYAHMLEEALGWGFDIDTWRAHLSSETWPEVLRQVRGRAGVQVREARGCGAEVSSTQH